MPFQLAAIFIGLVVGWLRKGTLSSITHLRLRWLWILPIAYVLQNVSIVYMNGGFYKSLLVLSYVLLIGFTISNLTVAGVAWTLAGTISNFLVMLVNNLKMPVYMDQIRSISPQMVSLLQDGNLGKHIAMGGNTHLNFLGDIFFIKTQPPILVSIGDILFAIGIAVLIQHAMRVGREPI